MTQPLKTLAPPTLTSRSALFQARGHHWLSQAVCYRWSTVVQMHAERLQSAIADRAERAGGLPGAAGSREGDVGALAQAVLTTDPATSTR